MRFPTKPSLTLAAAAVLLAAPVLAQPRQWGPRHGAPGDDPRLERMFERLDLTADQREQARQIFENHRRSTEAYRDELRAKREAMVELVHSAEMDELAIRQASAEVAAVKTELIVARAALVQQLRQVLNPQQFEQWEQMRQLRRGFQRHGRRDGRGFGPRWSDPDEPGDEETP